MSKILVTGAAGFIGFHLAKRLAEAGHEVLGIDNLNDYYDVSLKEARLKELEPLGGFAFTRLELADREGVAAFFETHRPEIVVHLAAQAGVRYSLENPAAYIDSNLVGFANILEGCRHNNVRHLIFASSSSVYGTNEKLPFAIEDPVDHPISLYAATKKSNELMAHSYAHLYGFPVTGLRFFTVYGPWGRPDMAVYGFTEAIVQGRPIKVFNHGDMMRDFTYIDDVIEPIMRLAEASPQKESKDAPYRIYNIGNNKPEKLMDMIAYLEQALGMEAQKEFLPMQPGDVYATYADVDDLIRDTGFAPDTPLKEGLARFVAWYKRYYDLA